MKKATPKPNKPDKTKPPCTVEEFNQFEEIYHGFCWLLDRQSAAPNSAFKSKQQEVLNMITDFWPNLKLICGSLSVSMETRLTDGLTPGMQSYAAHMAGKPSPKIIEPDYNSIDLDMISRVVSGRKPYTKNLNRNLVDDILQVKSTERQYVEELFHKVKAKLGVCFPQVDKSPDAGTPDGKSTAKTKESNKPAKKTQTKKKEAERQFKPWPNVGDACFIIDEQRIFFYYDGKKKDLCLKNDSHTQNLLVCLNGGTLREDEIKTNLCTKKTKPSKIVARANKLLNEKIAQKGFVLPLKDILFVEYDKRFRHYKLTLPMLNEEQFLEKQLEQPLVDDSGLKALDEDEESFG